MINRTVRTKLSLVCCALFYATTTTASPPQLPIATMWAPSLRKQPSTGATLGEFRITFEQTTLNDVVLAALGGTIVHQGDAGGSVYWLCYSNPGVGYIDRIWIQSSGEMGGTDHAVTEITAERLHNIKPSADCPPLPANLRPVAFDGRLWLGVPKQLVESVLGPPSLQRGPWRSFDFQGKLAGACQGGFDLTSWLITKTDDDRVALIAAGQITSC
jgi:hypothetical protein